MSTLISDSLEKIAETHGDIGAECFERFYGASDEARQLMSHMDDVHKSKMMNEIYRLLMVTDLEEDESYIEWESKTHQTVFSVPDASMFEVLMFAVRDVAREALAGDWNDDLEAAWTERSGSIAKAFAKHYTAE